MSEPSEAGLAGASPPKVRLVYRVGTVGHRPKPERLASDPEELKRLAAQVRRALQAVRLQVEAFAAGDDAAVYAPGGPRLVAVSSLAEGADRIVAEQALDLAYALTSPIPFVRETFELDFDPPTTLEAGSRERFAAIAARARTGEGLTLFEIDGERGPDTLAYARCARVVVSQSDLLLAIWDGKPAAGPGGAPDSVREALAAGVPVLWIDAHAPFGWRLLRRPEEVAPLERQRPCELPAAPDEDPAKDAASLSLVLRDVVINELAPPRLGADQPDPVARKAIADFQAERRPDWNLAVLWKLFRDGMGNFKLRWPSFRTHDYVGQIADAWPVNQTAEGATPDSWLNARLRAQYAWADKCADRYADAHRSGFVATSFLTPLAVVAALLPIIAPRLAEAPWNYILIVSEVLIVSGIIGLLHSERSRGWHTRWMELRVLAELIRQLRLVIPVGGGRPRPRPRPHLSIYGDPAQSWMSWMERAIARDVGLPDAVVTPAYVAACLDDVGRLVTEQQSFHHASGERSERIHERLHVLSEWLFWLTVVGVAAHGAMLGVHFGEETSKLAEGLLVAVAAVSPALAAAFASVNNQGEFQRMAKRSEAMAAFFAAQRDAIETLRAAPAPPRLSDVEPLTRRIAEAMVDEVADWRVVVNDRALGV